MQKSSVSKSNKEKPASDEVSVKVIAPLVLYRGSSYAEGETITCTQSQADLLKKHGAI